jgi:hypothetical protein
MAGYCYGASISWIGADAVVNGTLESRDGEAVMNGLWVVKRGWCGVSDDFPTGFNEGDSMEYSYEAPSVVVWLAAGSSAQRPLRHAICLQ